MDELERIALSRFIRSSYDAWRDGCQNCVVCSTISSYENGHSNAETFEWRMKLLFTVIPNTNDHPLELPRPQLSLFVNPQQGRTR